MEDDMIGQCALEEAAIDPVAPPPHPQRRRYTAQTRPGQFGQERQELLRPHRPPLSAAMVAAYFEGPPWNPDVPATSTVAPAAMARLAVSGVMPPSTSRWMSRPVAS